MWDTYDRLHAQLDRLLAPKPKPFGPAARREDAAYRQGLPERIEMIQRAIAQAEAAIKGKPSA